MQLGEMYLEALRRLEAHKAETDRRLGQLQAENGILRTQVRVVAWGEEGVEAVTADELSLLLAGRMSWAVGGGDSVV